MTERNPNYDEQLAAIEKELQDLEALRLQALIEIGEKALPRIREESDFADLAVKVDEIAEKTRLLKQQESSLHIEKSRYEKEQKELLIKRTCVNCKTVNPEDSKFCEECGNPIGFLPREYCKACSFMNHSGMKFCGECGAKLDEVAAEA